MVSLFSQVQSRVILFFHKFSSFLIFPVFLFSMALCDLFSHECCIVSSLSIFTVLFPCRWSGSWFWIIFQPRGESAFIFGVDPDTICLSWVLDPTNTKLHLKLQPPFYVPLFQQCRNQWCGSVRVIIRIRIQVTKILRSDPDPESGSRIRIRSRIQGN